MFDSVIGRWGVAGVIPGAHGVVFISILQSFTVRVRVNVCGRLHDFSLGRVVFNPLADGAAQKLAPVPHGGTPFWLVRTRPMHSSHRHRYFICLLMTVLHANHALTPLTEIQASEEELNVFPLTMRAALSRAGIKLSGAIVHVMGASDVEDAVDWSILCRDGLTIVLVGPQVAPLAKMVRGEEVVARKRTGQECVQVIRSLYSVDVVKDALGTEGSAAADPDLVIAFNADVYQEYWRRTLASLMLLRIPVAVTFYCEYEGGELSKVLDKPISAFSADAMDTGDGYIRKRYRGDADHFLALTLAAPAAQLPAARSLWQFEPNPNAHRPPIDCLAKPYRHGVRNAFWTAFIGAVAPVREPEPDEEGQAAASDANPNPTKGMVGGHEEL